MQKSLNEYRTILQESFFKAFKETANTEQFSWFGRNQRMPIVPANITEEMVQRAKDLDGIYTALCEQSEYIDLLEVGLLKRSYDHNGGFLGLSVLFFVEPSNGQ